MWVSGTALKSAFDTVPTVSTFLEKCYSLHINKDSSSPGEGEDCRREARMSTSIAGQPRAAGVDEYGYASSDLRNPDSVDLGWGLKIYIFLSSPMAVMIVQCEGYSDSPFTHLSYTDYQLGKL